MTHYTTQSVYVNVYLYVVYCICICVCNINMNVIMYVNFESIKYLRINLNTLRKQIFLS